MTATTASTSYHHPPARRWLRFLFQCSMAVLIMAVYVFNERLRDSSTITAITTDSNHKNNHKNDVLPESPQNEHSSVVKNSQPEPMGLSPHAKQVLLAAARDRVQELDISTAAKEVHDTVVAVSNSSTANHNNMVDNVLPPLDSLVRQSNSQQQQQQSNNGDPQIIANVQFLLDFAVVGFGKCGTTTLLQWLQQTNPNSTTSSTTVRVRAPNYEAQFLNNQRPAQLVRKMYNFAVEEQEARQIDSNVRIVKGFKNPSDIRRPHSRALLQQYWPQTPLIVTVRHPVDWMVSLYNYFKIEKGAHKAHLPADDILDRGGRDFEGNTKRFVSTAKGEFHAILAELGKTPLIANSEEWNLLKPWLDPEERDSIKKDHYLPNPIFFMEMQQLSDSNTTRAQVFAHDLEKFLGLPPNHLPFRALHVRPNADRVKKKKKQSMDDLKLDICDPDYKPVLEEMMAISRAASLWFRTYFMASPNVTVSSPEYLNQLFEGWMVNPCDNAANDGDDGGNSADVGSKG